MKNTRKLIPALAMLLLAAVMMSTASFAWFTMNDTVQASNMQVTAVAPASLWISQNTDTPVWGSSINLSSETPTEGVTAGQFKPVTLRNTAAAEGTPGTAFDAWVFKQLTSAASEKVAIDGTLAGQLSDADLEASNSYYKDKFLVRLESTEGDRTTLSVAVKVSDLDATVTDAIWKALRVAVVIDGEALTFAFDDDNSDGEPYAALGATAAAKKFEKLIVAGSADTEVVVYAWYEGTDKDCFNANALNTDTFKIDLVFSIGEVTPAPATGA